MYKSYKVADKFYWVGAIDWNLRDFHGYSTEKGSSYNAFLMVDDKITLFDTVKASFTDEMLERIKDVVELAKIDYIVVNHVEMDHSGSLAKVVDIIKPEKIICSAKGKEALLNHFKRPDWPYHVVKTGDKISTGKQSISFIETPMLHWPDSMFSYINEQKILVSSDAFGQHWATSERFDDEVDFGELVFQAGKYYANIIMPYSNLVQNLLKAVGEMGLKIDLIAPDHGLMWRKNIPAIIKSYDNWSKPLLKKKAVIVFDTMWKSTELMAQQVAEGLISQGVIVKLMKMGENDRSDVMTEVLDAKAVIFGSSTLNNDVLPRMADVMTYMKGLKPAGRIGACLNSYGWNPTVIKKLNTELEASGIKLVDEGIAVKYVPEQSDLKKCFDMGVKIASLIL